VLITLGYAGWGGGQLEQEIAANGWLTVAADPYVLFDLDPAERYSAAVKLLGFDPAMLSSEVGHA
jgi:putative transcriptional regulator